MKRVTGEVLEVGVDWITCVGFSKEAQQDMQKFGSITLHSEGAAGFEMRPWSFAGYSGFKCGGAQVGVRQDSTCIRLSSETAGKLWQQLYVMSESVTRVDLMVTIRPVRGPMATLATAHRQALRSSSKRKDGPAVTMIRGNDGSGTLYLGKRLSDSYGRVYTKGIESGLEWYANTLRFEVEFKGDKAVEAMRRITRDTPHMVAIAGLVSGFFARRGVALTLPSVPHLALSASRRRTDVERRLLWLETQVRPTVQLLIDQGCYDEVARALGLSRTVLNAP